MVCIHGYCQSSAYWAPTVERIAQHGGHALAVDLPGFAGSASLPGPYTMEAFADAVAALLDELGIARAIVVGGSMGASWRSTSCCVIPPGWNDFCSWRPAPTRPIRPRPWPGPIGSLPRAGMRMPYAPLSGGSSYAAAPRAHGGVSADRAGRLPGRCDTGGSLQCAQQRPGAAWRDCGANADHPGPPRYRAHGGAWRGDAVRLAEARLEVLEHSATRRSWKSRTPSSAGPSVLLAGR